MSLDKLSRRITLRSVFNFRRELVRIKMNNKYKNLSSNTATLIGATRSRKKVHIPDDCKHILCVGTTGSGKTVTLSNFISHAIENNYPCLAVDGKGDIGANSMLEITRDMANEKHRKFYIIDMNNPSMSDKYNPFKNASPTIIKDMLINMTEWSEEHYKLNTERYIQRVVHLLSKFNIDLSFRKIIQALSIEKFQKMSVELLKMEQITKAQHLENLELAKTSGKIAESAVARFATLAESDIGQIFHSDGIDIYSALNENAVILFVLNPMIYPEMAPLLGKLILIDTKKAVSNLFNDHRRKFFVFDEIGTYASDSLLDLVNKSRSANVTNILAMQSFSDLDRISEQFKEQIVENCNNYLILRQNSPNNAQLCSEILGTRSTMEVTYQLQQRGLDTTETGFGSARRTREFLYHPDLIKALKLGEAIFMSKDMDFHSPILINKPF